MELLDQIFLQAQARFGSAIKSPWFYDGDGCPGCGNEIDSMNFKGQRSLSINAFIYREHGVLIGYLLCAKCAKKIFKLAERNPNGKTPLHGKIEKKLQHAFMQHLGH